MERLTAVPLAEVSLVILFILATPFIASVAGMYFHPDNFNNFLVSGIISLIVLVIAFIAGRKIS